jgi:hypothetical protein
MKRLMVLAAVACSSAPPPSFGTTAITSATSAACGATFDVYTAPDPLVRGPASIELVATESSTKTPLPGLTITMVPFMPAMGHGSATTPAVVDRGSGVYIADDVVLAMPGTWQLRTNIGGACSDALVIDVDVQ